MTGFEYGMVGGVLAILGFLWSLHRDIRSLSDRVSRIEGFLQGRMMSAQDLQSHHPAE